MSKVRKIIKEPTAGNKNFYFIDACFLANRFIPQKFADTPNNALIIKKCQEWWDQINIQVKNGNAKIIIPDLCIAESFKVLAKKYFYEKWFTRYSEFKKAKDKLSEFVRIDFKELKSKTRKFNVHDNPTNRDIIIAVDRFFEPLYKKKLKKDKDTSIIDLIIPATAKYYIELFNIDKKYIHIVTLDNGLKRVIRKVKDLPNAYDPSDIHDAAEKIFVSSLV